MHASTSHDLFFAQCYVNAQDRFWQLDFWRHIGAGRRRCLATISRSRYVPPSFDFTGLAEQGLETTT